jgi:hypothetical protein
MKFKKGDRVVRTKPYSSKYNDDERAMVGDVTTLIAQSRAWQYSWKVESPHYGSSGYAIWDEYNFELESVYNSPLYKALS